MAVEHEDNLVQQVERERLAQGHPVSFMAKWDLNLTLCLQHPIGSLVRSSLGQWCDTDLINKHKVGSQLNWFTFCQPWQDILRVGFWKVYLTFSDVCSMFGLFLTPGVGL